LRSPFRTWVKSTLDLVKCIGLYFQRDFTRLMRPGILVFISLFIPAYIYSQYIPVHPRANDVYSYLDEFRLSYNPAIKPLSRKEISEYLLSLNDSLLNPRQKKELAFYLRDYGKELHSDKNFSKRADLLYYGDPAFSLTVNPLLGGNAWVNRNSFEYHWWNGAEAVASYGNWGFYASLRDNHLSSKIFSPTYLDQHTPASLFKVAKDGKTDFEEIMGGATYSWKTGHIGLLKENFTWGTNYHGSNIFSGHTPAFVHLDLQIHPVKWFDFHYVHGWLNSMIVDSTRSFYLNRSYGTLFRTVYHGKFLAANMFTFTPFKDFNVSIGNSIIYDYDQVHPAYLIPVMFFKAVDHNLTSGIQNMNSQMYADISSKNINHLHLYASLFLDELAIDRIRIKNQHNFASLKTGIRVNDLIPDFFGGVEYTITNALTFKHFVPTTTFESNLYNLGSYLTDNAKELFLTAGWKPVRNMCLEISYTDIIKGPDHTALGTMPREEIESFIPVVYESRSLEFNASWQVINDLYVRLGFAYRKVTGDYAYLVQYAPEFLWGNTSTVNFGLNFGF
jgi:hypothetical protein